MPAQDAGEPCSNRSECDSGWCSCPFIVTVDDPGLPDGTEVEGSCTPFPVASGSGWQCIIHEGQVQKHGIIVD
jgi:hypothetical protein